MRWAIIEEAMGLDQATKIHTGVSRFLPERFVGGWKNLSKKPLPLSCLCLYFLHGHWVFVSQEPKMFLDRPLTQLSLCVSSNHSVVGCFLTPRNRDAFPQPTTFWCFPQKIPTETTAQWDHSPPPTTVPGITTRPVSACRFAEVRNRSAAVRRATKWKYIGERGELDKTSQILFSVWHFAANTVLSPFLRKR